MIGLRLHCDDIVLRCAADGFAGVVLGCLLSDDGRLLIKVELMENQSGKVGADGAARVLGRPCSEPAHRVAPIRKVCQTSMPNT